MTNPPLRRLALLAAHAAAATARAAEVRSPPSRDGGGVDVRLQSLPTPYHGQHVGVSLYDLNGDGAVDVLFAAGRHWVDQPYALINLGPWYDGNGEFKGVRFSEALPVGRPGGYYQIDVKESTKANINNSDEGRVHSTVLLVGGTCHVTEPNEFGSCSKGENTPARVVRVTMKNDEGGGCSIQYPERECVLDYEEVWEHPDPKGDRNGGFAEFGGKEMVALLGQGGIELFESAASDTPKVGHVERSADGRRRLHGVHTSYSAVYHHPAPPKTDPRSDYARYAGFAAGSSPKLGGVVAAGRRSDYDPPNKDSDGNIVGINELVYRSGEGAELFRSTALSSKATGEPYAGDGRYSLQSTNYAFADIDGDGVEDLLEATFLYERQRVPGYPLPQRVHFLDRAGKVLDTLVVLEDGAEKNGDGRGDGDDNDYIVDDAGRSVTTGQVFSDSPLPDVVFASAEGVVTIFANRGVDDDGKFRGLQLRHEVRVADEGCQVRDVAVSRLAVDVGDEGGCWVGIVCAVTCGVKEGDLGDNRVVYVKGSGAVCSVGDGAIVPLMAMKR